MGFKNNKIKLLDSFLLAESPINKNVLIAASTAFGAPELIEMQKNNIPIGVPLSKPITTLADLYSLGRSLMFMTLYQIEPDVDRDLSDLHTRVLEIIATTDAKKHKKTLLELAFINDFITTACIKEPEKREEAFKENPRFAKFIKYQNGKPVLVRSKNHIYSFYEAELARLTQWANINKELFMKPRVKKERVDTLSDFLLFEYESEYELRAPPQKRFWQKCVDILKGLFLRTRD